MYEYTTSCYIIINLDKRRRKTNKMPSENNDQCQSLLLALYPLTMCLMLYREDVSQKRIAKPP